MRRVTALCFGVCELSCSVVSCAGVAVIRAARAVVASTDVIAANVAGIAVGLRRSGRASAVWIDSLGEGAGDPAEGRDGDARDVVDEVADAAVAVGVLRAISVVWQARGRAGRNVARRGFARRSAGFDGRNVAGRFTDAVLREGRGGATQKEKGGSRR